MESHEVLLKIKEVEAMVGYSKSIIRTLVKKGDFPAPVEFSTKKHRWVKAEVEEWLNKKIEERRGSH
jgi:predicted DNA-binding transcriptional regulator AlpA